VSFEWIVPFLRPTEPLLLDESISEIMAIPMPPERNGILFRNRPFPSTPQALHRP